MREAASSRPLQSKNASIDEVERIGDLERAFGVPAIQIALLVADGGEDGIGLFAGFDLGTFTALERHNRFRLVVIGTGHETSPILESGAMKVSYRDPALGVAPSGDEKHRDVLRADGIEKFKGRIDRLGPVDPRGKAAWQCRPQRAR